MSRLPIIDPISVLNRVFTPSAPIEDRKIFAGRQQQLHRVIELVDQPGVHGIVYGERGVGKTSVANIVKLILSDTGTLIIKCSCSTEDTFETLWRKAFRQISFSMQAKSIGFGNTARSTGTATLEDLVHQYSVSDVVSALSGYFRNPVVIIFDEFDRLGDGFDRRKMADTIKSISDDGYPITLIIVGVGEDVVELLGEHPSIERNIRQIHLPIMADSELHEIIEKGLAELDMSVNHEIAHKIVRFSCGYPHYTHLLAYHASRIAIGKARNEITEVEFDEAVERSIVDANARLTQSYQTATLATKPNIFREVLYACSVAPIDENGTFQAMDLVDPLSEILRQPVSVNKFTYHLGKFCNEDRGRVLSRIGVPKRHRYRFRDPLMRSFVLLNLYNSIHANEAAQYEQLRLFIFGD